MIECFLGYAKPCAVESGVGEHCKRLAQLSMAWHLLHMRFSKIFQV